MEQARRLADPPAESRLAFEAYLSDAFPGVDITRVELPGPDWARFGYTVHLSDGDRTLIVRYEFWSDTPPNDVRRILNFIHLAGEMQAHPYLTLVRDTGAQQGDSTVRISESTVRLVKPGEGG